MLEISLKIRDMDKESSNGMMVENMKGVGLKESSMESAYTETRMVKNKKVSGWTAEG